MANSDWVVRMLLDGRQFDNALKSSKQQVDNIGKGITAGFTKILGAAGLAMGGFEAFNKAVMSTNKSGDEFENTINAAKNSVDAYFRSLITGDWTIFQNGIFETFRGLKELSATLDDLADKRLSLDYIKSQDAAEIAELLVDARDTTLDLQKRTEALNKAKQKTLDLDRNTNSYIESNRAALEQTYKATYGIELTMQDLDRFFRGANFGDPSQLSAIREYEDTLRRIEKENTVTKIQGSSITGTYTTTYLSEQGQRLIDQYKNQNSELQIQSILLNESDVKRKETLRLLQEQYNLMREVSAQEKAINRIGGTLANQTNKANGSVAVEGSLSAMSQAIKAQQKIFEDTADAGIRAGAQKAIDELKNRQIILNASLRFEGASNIRGSQGFVGEGLIANNRDNLYNSLGDKIMPIQPGVIASNYDYADSLNSIASIMGSISGNLNNSASSWVSYVGNLLSATASAIPALNALSTAQATAAITGSAAANASIPVVGWITALASVAALVAAFTNIPKFATGGIVPGTSYSGDKVPVMANSGEMILNDRQQARLFNMINGGGGTGRLQIEVFARGSELRGVLNNYDNKVNKY